jgi:DNA mismatch repair protein MutL
MEGADMGAVIAVDGGLVSPVAPMALNRGTIVTVRDLFFNVPARLKFLRTAQAETGAAQDVVQRIALAHPHVHFTFAADSRAPLEHPSAAGEDRLLKRVRQVLGADFAASALDVDAEREGALLYGHISPPAQNRANSRMQFAFVNGRAVRDRQILGAIAAAYSDRLPRGRHAACALHIEIDPALVDVNVHPAKAEVRFRDPGNIRALIIGGIRRALDAQGLAADTRAAGTVAAFTRKPGGAPAHASSRPIAPLALSTPLEAFSETETAGFAGFAPSARRTEPVPQNQAEASGSTHRLGAAKAQVHRNYIVAQTADSLILVDQHAAHERLVFEALKRGITERGTPSQMLLIPEIVDLAAADAERLLRHAGLFSKLGLMIEGFGDGAVAVGGTPSMLGRVDAQALIRDLADEIAEQDDDSGLMRRLNDIAATMACHGSVRSGRELRAEEMDALLRQMEATPGSDTCNHGRPTFVELKLADIERLFERR